MSGYCIHGQARIVGCARCKLEAENVRLADALSSKEAEIAELRRALKPFAEEAKQWDGDAPDRRNLYGRTADGELEPTTLTLGDLRRAAALSPSVSGLSGNGSYDARPLSDALRAQPKGWEPIETAPKDTDAILVAVPFSDVDEPPFHHVTVARWDDGYAGAPDQPGWAATWVCALYGDFVSPSHWMHLPKPPLSSPHVEPAATSRQPKESE